MPPAPRAARDIAICGCGPAGLSAALFLHRAGHRVTLFERFSVPKPLGSGLMLQMTGLSVLSRLGLSDAVHARGHRVDRFVGRAVPSGRLVLDVRYAALSGNRYALAVHRAALFEVLFNEVQRLGIPVEGEFELEKIDAISGDRAVIVDRTGRREGPFDLVIDALGSRSPTLSQFYRLQTEPLSYGALWATLPLPPGAFAENTLEQRYQRASVMIGVLPVGRHDGANGEQVTFFWSLKSEDFAAWQSAGLEAWKDRVRALWPDTDILLRQISDPAQLTFARYSHHTLRQPHFGMVATIGDAAHSTSPQLGQGANMAMLDAAALADALAEKSEIPDALAAYAKQRRLHIRLYQVLSAAFTPFYQSDSRVLPFIRDLLVAPAARIPFFSRVLASMVVGSWGLRQGPK
jgi:salicylate hydroxylase